MQKPNRLINEKSPYLQQHAYNPVDWYPWGNEAFSRSKSENKPIFLSIGYSTCYWCHVMKRECFENRQIAELMNEYFINVKVDREELPEIDKIYMTALQSITGSGGWPMNMFLTPHLKPFYGATYIPPKAKYGRAGIEDIFIQINNLWKEKQSELLESSDKIFGILNQRITKTPFISDDILKKEVSEECFKTALRIFDYENGGFGQGNKFPRPSLLNFLLKYYRLSGNTEALDMVTYTLLKIYRGGIFDHIDGGFHRYSVDKFWRVPHFEKMLYDQALITDTLLDTYLITRNITLLECAEKTLGYSIEKLYNGSGGFCSAEDAESFTDISQTEKAEGYFYMWEQDELNEILEKDEFIIFTYIFGIKYEGNTLNDPHSVFGKRNVLHIANDIFEASKEFNKSPEEIKLILEDSINKIKTVRDKRIRPGLDDKILTSQNGLMLNSLANAYRITQNRKYLDIAIKTADFLLNNLIQKDILYHRYKDGEIKFSGTLEDYAFLVKGLITLYESSFQIKYLDNAIELTDKAVELFFDNEYGGFFDTEENRSDVILRVKELYDGALPSGNSVMIENLIKLNSAAENKLYREKAMKSLEFFYEEIESNPFSYPQAIFSLLLYLNPFYEIIISGNKENTLEFKKVINEEYIPGKILMYADTESSKSVNKLATYNINEEKVFICYDYKCEKPVDNPSELKEKLKSLQGE
ncbi:MAG: thioredoxin domain-containing protein [Ignavibacteria bacterium]|nr:thioredoxin domain-containing protein [Ignavibacteria bacterium]